MGCAWGGFRMELIHIIYIYIFIQYQGTRLAELDIGGCLTQ